jgi:hypothetical protein
MWWFRMGFIVFLGENNLKNEFEIQKTPPLIFQPPQW